MRWIDGLSKAQRVVVVIALGLGLGELGSYLVNIGNVVVSGWYAYSPLTIGTAGPHTGLHRWMRLVIWLVLIGIWALGSIWVLRPAPGDASSG
jgi:hypothetical protein